MNPPALVALADGSVFEGRSVGSTGDSLGEMVFNTSMTGYQEILTDPSYAGQIVSMTYPHIGNYGINPEDDESGRPHVVAFLMKQCCPRPSNRRATRAGWRRTARPTPTTPSFARPPEAASRRRWSAPARESRCQ